MANLPMPPINFSGPEPSSIEALVTPANTARPATVVYTRSPLVYPASSQIFNERAAGYPS